MPQETFIHAGALDLIYLVNEKGELVQHIIIHDDDGEDYLTDTS